MMNAALRIPVPARPTDSVAAEPAYLALLRSGALGARVREAWARLADCDLCPHACHVDRHAGAAGAVCRTGARAVVASFRPQFGEEDSLVGSAGSGTIFFAMCNLRCQFCQNFEVSQLGYGQEVTPREIAVMMLHLQGAGCHNINLVTPSHVVPQILAAVLHAAEAGLRLPLVYNTGGYDCLESLEFLDGVVDVYLPDMKYAADALARQYSKVQDYPTVNRIAVKEMHRQVGDLAVDDDGIARRGLLVRHLVLPGGIAGTEEIAVFLADEVSRDTYLHIMDRYQPWYRARELEGIDRPATPAEVAEAVRAAQRAGLRRVEFP